MDVVKVPVEETMATAGLLEKPWTWGKFDLAENNCGHFATYCKTGEKVSRQAIDAMREAMTVVPLVATGWDGATGGLPLWTERPN